MELAQDKRGQLKEMKYLTPTRSSLVYEMPLAEVRAHITLKLRNRNNAFTQ
jgi:GTP-binding protein LepA